MTGAKHPGRQKTLVRPAKFGDIPRVQDLFLELRARSRYADEPYSERRFKDACVTSISEEAACLLVAEISGRVEGFLLGVTDWIYAFGKNRYATDVMLYVSAKGRGAFPTLVKAFILWASRLPEKYRVRRVWLGCTDAVSDPEKVARVYERMGMKRIGYIYEVELGSAP